MKRIISIVLFAAMLFTLTVPAAFAAGGVAANVSGAQANAGDEITLYISLSNLTEGYISGKLTVTCDAGLTLVSLEGVAFNGYSLGGSINHASAKAETGTTLAKATIKIDANAVSGNYNVYASVQDMVTEDFTPISVNAGVGTVTVHGHAAAGNWKTSSTHHWHTCSCGQEMDKALHIPGPAATVDNPQVCTVCNYELAPKLPEPHTHVYGEWTYYSTTQHIRECSCGSKELGDHVLDENNLCTVCGHQFPQDIPDDPDEPGFVLDSYQLAQLLLLLRNRTYDITATAGEGGMITPAGTTKVKYRQEQTYVITPAVGYMVESVVVDGKNVGAIREYTFKDVRAKHTITATFKMIPWTNPFSDVTTSDWFYNDVACAYYLGLMNGTASDAFSPNETATRAQIVTTLWRAEGKPVVENKAAFTDVEEGIWYTDAIAWAAENKIVEGYGDGIFAPGDAITREQIAAILHRYAEYKKLAVAAKDEAPDAYDHSDWAADNVDWAHENGIFAGIGKDITDLTENATRAEIASYLTRFCLVILA